MSLHTGIAGVRQLLDEIAESVPRMELADVAATHFELTRLNRDLVGVRKEVETMLGTASPEHTTTIEGVGTWTRHGRGKRNKWDTPSLLAWVMDSRLVDKTTGEVTEETPLDKVLTVWNLGAPRTTALAARGLPREELDEFCEVTEEPGFTIEVVSDDAYWKGVSQ
jgi:hypothetical protein